MTNIKQHSNYNYLLFIVPAAVAVASLGLLFAALQFNMLGPFHADCIKFCEMSKAGLVKQPVNTFSNIGFIIAGLLSAWHLMKGTYKHNRNNLTQHFFFGIFFSSVVVFLGPASMAMHASEKSVGLYFDRLSMYLIAALIFAYAAKRNFKLGTLGFLVTFAAVLCVCHVANVIEYSNPVWKNAVFGTVLVSALILELFIHFGNKSKMAFKWLAASAISFSAAIIIWKQSLTNGSWCLPHSPVQGHALWHLLCALAMFFLFRFYVSENERSGATA